MLYYITYVILYIKEVSELFILLLLCDKPQQGPHYIAKLLLVWYTRILEGLAETLKGSLHLLKHNCPDSFY